MEKGKWVEDIVEVVVERSEMFPDCQIDWFYQVLRVFWFEGRLGR